MSAFNIVLPSKPRIVSEEPFSGMFEIDNLYPGYGQTLGNSLRRIILSSLPGAAITAVKITGVSHEFSTIEGVKEDAINIILNLKKIRIRLHTDEPQMIRLNIKGIQAVTAGDIEKSGQVEILNPEAHIATITNKNTSLEMELRVERGIGYVPKENLFKDKVDIGMIALDAIFTPVRRASYEVEDMRVGDRTNFNRLKIFIETDGTISPREVLERSIEIMIHQLKAIVGFKEEDMLAATEEKDFVRNEDGMDDEIDVTKIKIETVGLSSRTQNALISAGIKTVGGLSRKREEDLQEVNGLGNKGIEEIKALLSSKGLSLKQ